MDMRCKLRGTGRDCGPVWESSTALLTAGQGMQSHVGWHLLHGAPVGGRKNGGGRAEVRWQWCW